MTARKAVKTEGSNITANETSKAEMDRFGIIHWVRMEHILQILLTMYYNNYLLSRVIVIAKESGYGQFPTG